MCSFYLSQLWLHILSILCSPCAGLVRLEGAGVLGPTRPLQHVSAPAAHLYLTTVGETRSLHYGVCVRSICSTRQLTAPVACVSLTTGNSFPKPQSTVYVLGWHVLHYFTAPISLLYMKKGVAALSLNLQSNCKDNNYILQYVFAPDSGCIWWQGTPASSLNLQGVVGLKNMSQLIVEINVIWDKIYWRTITLMYLRYCTCAYLYFFFSDVICVCGNPLVLWSGTYRMSGILIHVRCCSCTWLTYRQNAWNDVRCSDKRRGIA